MKRLILFLSISACFADNESLFNEFYNLGKQKQFNMNLNANSTINSYGQANKFTGSVADGANQGNAPARNMYDKTYGDKADPNYLYKEGIRAIKDCQDQSDPRCTTLNKYGDKDTQTQIQAYTQGFAEKYNITIKPDPIDSACSTITRKEPINEVKATCIAGVKEQSRCSNTIIPSLSMKCNSTQTISDRTHRPTDPTGRCDYINVKLSCSSGNYNILLATEDCSHSGYSSQTSSSFIPNQQQQSGSMYLQPTWSGGSDGCSAATLVLQYNYYCDSSGTCNIDFSAHCGNNQPFYSKYFNFSSLTTKEYNYQYVKGCNNAD